MKKNLNTRMPTIFKVEQPRKAGAADQTFGPAVTARGQSIGRAKSKRAAEEVVEQPAAPKVD
jgi:hypothetical protein